MNKYRVRDVTAIEWLWPTDWEVLDETGKVVGLVNAHSPEEAGRAIAEGRMQPVAVEPVPPAPASDQERPNKVPITGRRSLPAGNARTATEIKPRRVQNGTSPARVGGGEAVASVGLLSEMILAAGNIWDVLLWLTGFGIGIYATISTLMKASGGYAAPCLAILWAGAVAVVASGILRPMLGKLTLAAWLLYYAGVPFLLPSSLAFIDSGMANHTSVENGVVAVFAAGTWLPHTIWFSLHDKSAGGLGWFLKSLVVFPVLVIAFLPVLATVLGLVGFLRWRSE